MAGGSTTVDGVDVAWIDHASVRVEGSVTVYVDPWSEVLQGDEPQGDLILITHSHFDHFDPEAIEALSKEDSFVVLCGADPDEILQENEVVDIGHHDEHHGVEVQVVPGYNDHRFRDEDTKEPFHPADQGCGYVFTVDGVACYHAGDTDFIDEMDDLAEAGIDVAFIPIGGTYTMDQEEAVDAVAAIQPRIVVPIHYGVVDGTEADPAAFKAAVEERTDATVQLL